MNGRTVLAAMIEEVKDVVAPPGIVERAVARGRTMRRRRGLAAAGSVTVALTASLIIPTVVQFHGGGEGPPSRPGPSTSQHPTESTTGASPAIPYAVGTTIVDGDLLVGAPGLCSTWSQWVISTRYSAQTKPAPSPPASSAST